MVINHHKSTGYRIMCDRYIIMTTVWFKLIKTIMFRMFFLSHYNQPQLNSSPSPGDTPLTANVKCSWLVAPPSSSQKFHVFWGQI